MLYDLALRMAAIHTYSCNMYDSRTVRSTVGPVSYDHMIHVDRYVLCMYVLYDMYAGLYRDTGSSSH